jgi:hypothetical protein
MAILKRKTPLTCIAYRQLKSAHRFHRHFREQITVLFADQANFIRALIRAPLQARVLPFRRRIPQPVPSTTLESESGPEASQKTLMSI